VTANARPGELAAFRAVGGHLARRGLVRGAEGNLSTLAGDRLLITRTGCRLDALGEDDVLVGTRSEPPAGASSDLAIHDAKYDDLGGAGAVVHAHPPGTVPHGWREGQDHGIYALGLTLEHAAASLELEMAAEARAETSVSAGRVVRPFGAARLVLGSDDRSAGSGPTGVPRVMIVDQTRLPGALEVVECRTVEDVADAIRRLAVRGAPALGVTAAFGVTLAAFGALGRGEPVREAVSKAGELLASTRPTAVNIRWAVDRLASATVGVSEGDLSEALLAEARAVERQDAEACSRIGWNGAEVIPDGAAVLTHCNTGMLATAGIGTAFGVLWCTHLAGREIHVWADETRPLLQGARLTAWELDRLGVPFTLIADAAAGSLMAAGRIQAVVVGADRIAANGDVANKVGTYPLAALAARHLIPFFVAAPASTVDPSTGSGREIPIEERDPGEVTHSPAGTIAPEGARAFNPAFDVTPADLVTAIVTDRGVVRPPFESGLRAVVEGAA
jgi:methylthioribose-1-phosphate isomerase